MMSLGAIAPSTSLTNSGVASPSSDTFEDNPSRLTTYLHQLAGCYEMEVDVILKDHSYARPWNWKPENVYVKPTKKLFFSKINATADKYRQDEEIDVESDVNEPPVPPLDLTRARHLMDEFQRLAAFARPDENDDWEDKIDKTLWSSVQNRVFTKVVRILTSERLARLAKSSSSIEPIFRRVSVDTAARRFRETLASAGWDWRVAQWLHSLLFDHLPQEYLAIYLDILQTLRLKIPQLVDKMIAVQPNINGKVGPITWDTLGTLLKRSWDPVTPSLNANRLKKLPGNPILVIAPSGVGSSVSSRQHKWASQLGALGMVVNVHTHLGLAANRMTMMVCIDQLVQATRAKIQDVRSDCPGRPLILVGFNTGAALACQVAQMEHVTAVICLGFPFLTAEGKRGTPDDTLMDIRCPVMFVIGQNATLVRPDDLEDLREKMLVETSLVVVGSADDHLRISTAKKISEGITQSMVDRCVLDEIGDFVGSILLQPHPLPLRSASMIGYEKAGKREPRKRRNSTSSSVESEPNSPTLKKSRPSTPVSSAMPGGLHATASTSVSKPGTLNTQATLVTVGGSYVNHTPTVKRKPRVVSNQKGHYVEHLITSRLSGQQATNTSGGITLNIGSLASLAPIGPIRLAPATVGEPTITSIVKTSGAAKSPVSSSRMSKLVPSSMSLQSASRIKTVLSSGKGGSRALSGGGYRHAVGERNSDAKLMNVLSSTAGSQIRVGAAVPAGGSVTGGLSNLLQNGKSVATLASPTTAARAPSTSSILLATNNSPASSASATTSATTKAADGQSKQSSDTSQGASQVQTSLAGSVDGAFGASYANIVVFGESADALSSVEPTAVTTMTTTTTPAMAAITTTTTTAAAATSVFPLGGKMRLSDKPIKSMPKITMNASGLSRGPRLSRNQVVSTNAAELDDELGNIFDIPIIFAKDDESLSAIEKLPLIATPPTVEERCARAKPATKVVLISNKQSKIQQATSKIVPQQQQQPTIICPAVPSLNHVILQTQSQSLARMPMQSVARSAQPPVKYTKIILTKRNTAQPAMPGERKEQIILTKTTPKMNAARILSVDGCEHRYAQTSVKLPPTQSNVGNDALEVGDTPKISVVERNCASSLGTETKINEIEKPCEKAEYSAPSNVN